ncbi:hypothetical protein M2109_001438 [Paenibacillus sp. PastH-3]|nr:hypothetical protein [Paenibacillus sp. PastH-4]MDH6442159.1 hypothetical protein [Paenibacillus sp. PastF-4]MDH6527127.1 hypothetical protein [Paenibacillus sp. PastH-3]
MEVRNVLPLWVSFFRNSHMETNDNFGVFFYLTSLCLTSMIFRSVIESISKVIRK